MAATDAQCTDILVCGGCKAVFTDICEMAKHKKECPAGNGGGAAGGGAAGKRASKHSTMANSDSCASSNIGSNRGSTGSGGGGAGGGGGGGGSVGGTEGAATPPRGGGTMTRDSRCSDMAAAGAGSTKGSTARASRTSRTSKGAQNQPETPVCDPEETTGGAGAGADDAAELCEDVDPCDEDANKGDDEKVPEILAVGSIIPRDHHWYSPIGLEPGNRILICGRFRRDNVVPIIDLWHNLDEQRVFFYSVCFDDERAVVGSKLDGKWVNKKAIPAEGFPFELASDFTLEIIVKEDAFIVNWRGVKGSGSFDYPFNYDVTKVNMLRIQELDMIYKIEKDWV